MIVKRIVPLVLVAGTVLGAKSSQAWQYKLSAMTPVKDVWRVTSQQLGVAGTPFSVTMRRLHGGK